MAAQHSVFTVIALTGGPGGGKSMLLAGLQGIYFGGRRAVVLEEAIRRMCFMRLDPRSEPFQCALVAIQSATEELGRQLLATGPPAVLLTHRGTLDPCAFWQSFGHSAESFYVMTRTTRAEHYARYVGVLHMESAAVRVPCHYRRYPDAHRPKSITEAARLDALLGELWGDHPHYRFIPARESLEEKLEEAMGALCEMCGDSSVLETKANPIA